MYKLIRSLLFCFDAEKVHHFSMNALKSLCSIGFIKSIIKRSFNFKETTLKYSIFDLDFPNRVGLGAGFDKNAKYLNELEAMGFGFVEIGTVTPLPQDGNEQPRLFRLPKDKALINRMGFNNEGVEKIAERLKKWKSQDRSLIIGGNIGKNKITPNELAWQDYEKCFIALHDYVDYFVVNVSSPNTPGLRALQEKDALHKILTNLQNHNIIFKKPKPILLKIAPDLSFEQIDDVIDLATEIQLDGLVVANTTIDRENLFTSAKKLNQIGVGGLSGAPLKQKSSSLVKYIYQKTNGKIPIIASGGIFTGADALEKINSGAALVQVWTGFIYEGPGIIKKICTSIATSN